MSYFNKLSKFTFCLSLLLTICFTNNVVACDFPTFIEGADRTYAVDDIISRNGKDYKVLIDGWANASSSDWAYAPGTGTYWWQAWALVNDPCQNNGGGGETCSDGIQNQDETGIDCGGTSCSPCGVTETCSDGIQNQDETGIDCGGTSCSPCGVTETCSDGIQNQDETGVDCGGTSCSPCGGGGGGGGNGQACTITTDDGLAQATYYTLLETGASSVVTCSYDAVNDIKGTFYGALETKTLHGPNGSTPAKYCGMCVEMVGPKATEIVQITDECPDCWEHNSGDTDIDLSTPAFAAIVGAQSIGRADITWSEVPCPWQTPLHVIVQGSNEWFAKVIIGNTVNRVASVEIKFNGSWEAMTRKVDNSWEKGNINGASKEFRITDIYGETVEISGIDFSANPTNSKTDAASNFTACGLTTSTSTVNSLDYVSVYPNPAFGEITFNGINEAQSIEIVNISGKVVSNQFLGGKIETAVLNISNLAPGIYVAKLTGYNNTGIVRFIKK